MQVLDIEMNAPVTIENDRSVFFHTEAGRDNEGNRTNIRKGFENIADAMEVYRMIRAMQLEVET